MKPFEIRVPVTFDVTEEAKSRAEAAQIVKRKLGGNGYHFDLMAVNLSGWLNFHNEAITEAEVWVNLSHLEDAEWEEY